ncbi:hypothetical protein JFL43_21430 [Viridibacillus sp. YIM B01967]|uniref:Peptide ABC transporter permease n=1 Tax=Viridibacillus soli TaxID=2798301 RepID=A0ABS1HD82_9BACL|nr:hypothetical protein [Viridibacillus soli]MBK3497336.1 hypothetical protein [Viridibacillus soli]
MQNILDRILKNLQFERLKNYWDGFKPVAFAVFDDKDIFLFNHPKCKEEPYIKLVKTEEFHACTCILFEEVPTAIVDTTFFDSFEVIYSLLVHESFHVFQHLSGESRYPNEILGFNYPIDFLNIQLRILERKRLFEAFVSTNLIEKQQKINEFITLRDKRIELFPNYVEYENSVETIEGPAFYVEYQALTDISSNKKGVISKYAEQLLDNNLSHINIRSSCYNSGLFICLLLDDISKDWKVEFIISKINLYHFFKNTYPNYTPIEVNVPKNSEEVSQIINNAKTTKLIAFKNFNKSEGIKLTVSGTIKLVGFDPMNITQLNTQALHLNFLSMKVMNKEYFIKQPVCTTFENNFRDVQLIELFLNQPPIHIDNRLIIENVGEFEGSVISKEPNSIHIVV